MLITNFNIVEITTIKVITIPDLFFLLLSISNIFLIGKKVWKPWDKLLREIQINNLNISKTKIFLSKFNLMELTMKQVIKIKIPEIIKVLY